MGDVVDIDPDAPDLLPPGTRMLRGLFGWFDEARRVDRCFVEVRAKGSDGPWNRLVPYAMARSEATTHAKFCEVQTHFPGGEFRVATAERLPFRLVLDGQQVGLLLLDQAEFDVLSSGLGRVPARVDVALQLIVNEADTKESAGKVDVVG